LRPKLLGGILKEVARSRAKERGGIRNCRNHRHEVAGRSAHATVAAAGTDR
jgi:hypothetical protein